MSKIKDVVETLANDWNWDTVAKHPARRQLLNGTLASGDLTVRLPNGIGFTFRHEKKNGDLRIWTKSNCGLLQWRSDPKKGDRLVYVPFGGENRTERLPLAEIFMDPKLVDEDEVMMFEVLYPDLLDLLPHFGEALLLADAKLVEEKLKRDAGQIPQGKGK